MSRRQHGACVPAPVGCPLPISVYPMHAVTVEENKPPPTRPFPPLPPRASLCCAGGVSINCVRSPPAVSRASVPRWDAGKRLQTPVQLREVGGGHRVEGGGGTGWHRGMLRQRGHSHGHPPALASPGTATRPWVRHIFPHHRGRKPFWMKSPGAHHRLVWAQPTPGHSLPRQPLSTPTPSQLPQRPAANGARSIPDRGRQHQNTRGRRGGGREGAEARGNARRARGALCRSPPTIWHRFASGRGRTARRGERGGGCGTRWLEHVAPIRPVPGKVT